LLEHAKDKATALIVPFGYSSEVCLKNASSSPVFAEGFAFAFKWRNFCASVLKRESFCV
jgi:hypothetical protein